MTGIILGKPTPRISKGPVMKTLVVASAILATVIAAGAPKPGPKPVEQNPLYSAYWLVGPDGRRDYQTLMVTPWPIEKLAGYKKWSDLPFDNMVMTFRTYERDSLWDSPFKPVKQIGAVDSKAKNIVLDGVTYTYEPGDLKDVIRLLEKPLGTIALHRRPHPLHRAENTARAFRLLLLDQMKAAQDPAR
jgi:hypothetical protein